MSQKRITIQDDYGDPTGSWFDPDMAQIWEDSLWWDGSNHISRATGNQFDHETLYRTAGGTWIVNRWSQWQRSRKTYRTITPAEAVVWFLRNELEPPAELAQYITESEL